MIDRAQTENVKRRVAISAFEYYPTKHLDELGYRVEEDVDWCLEPLAGLPARELEALRATVELLITTPTANRRPFIRYLAALSCPSVDGNPEDSLPRSEDPT